jgi:hypothetical protein
MQTFLPYPDFAKSAEVLDRQRLGKQRVEVLQILKALDLRYPEAGWANHPATKMWNGYAYALVKYGMVICTEWRSRGYKDSCYEKIDEFQHHGRFEHAVSPHEIRGVSFKRTTPYPPWLGYDALHQSHQSNLLRKDPEHYRPLFGDDVPDDLDYVWPKPWEARALTPPVSV